MMDKKKYDYDESTLIGVLIHDNGEVQLTYTKDYDIPDTSPIKVKTIIFEFFFSGCFNYETIKFPLRRVKSGRIEIKESNSGFVCFEDVSNGISIKCAKYRVNTMEVLSKAFGEKKREELAQTVLDLHEKRLDPLENLERGDGKKLFSNHNYYNGIEADHHIMWKLPSIRKNSNIEYEFLIELDKEDPSLGIYYGCRGIVTNGDIEEQIKEIENDLTAIKPKLDKRLNMLFCDKVFTNRFRGTDNANDCTYWPFWIPLYDDENIIDVAVHALIIIKDEYKKYIEGEAYSPDEIDACEFKDVSPEPGEVLSRKRFTKDSYGDLLEAYGKLPKSVSAETIEMFINNALCSKIGKTGKTYLEVRRFFGPYKTYKVNMSDREFAYMMYLLANKQSPPWKEIVKVFLNKKGEPFKNVNLRKAFDANSEGRDPEKKDAKDIRNKERGKARKEIEEKFNMIMQK